MSFCGDDFGNDVRKGGKRTNIKDRERIFAVQYAAVGEDNRDEVNAGRFEQRERR